MIAKLLDGLLSASGQTFILDVLAPVEPKRNSFISR